MAKYKFTIQVEKDNRDLCTILTEYDMASRDDVVMDVRAASTMSLAELSEILTLLVALFRPEGMEVGDVEWVK